MRSVPEILKRISEVREDDIFGTQRSDLVLALPFEQAKPFLDVVVSEEMFEEAATPDDAAVRRQIVGYLPFAWDKALGHRGLSATRSIDHFRAWTWLIGEDDNVDFSAYSPYGVPILAALSRRYGCAIPSSPEAERMSQGLPCSPDCYGGCV